MKYQQDNQPEKTEQQQGPEYEFDFSKRQPQEHKFVRRGNTYVCIYPGHHHVSFIKEQPMKQG